MAKENTESKEHAFADTAMGLGKAVSRATLTPVVGLGLMGVAAHDAVTTGVTGTFHRAQDLLGKTEKDSVDLKGCAVGEVVVDETDKTSTRKEATPVEIFFFETADWVKLRKQYVDKGIPFILRHQDGAKISSASPPAYDGPATADGNIHVQADSMKVKLDGIDDIIKKLLPRTWRAYWPLWFQGNYKSGLAHVDLGPGTVNFYYMKQGKKDVVIAPYDVTRKLSLKTGIDNLHIPGSSGNHDFLDDLDSYYRVLVEEQSILVFNNAGCLHHFTNVVEQGITPIALSVRCKHSLGSDPRGWLHLATDLKVWWNMTDHMLALTTSASDSRPQDKA